MELNICLNNILDFGLPDFSGFFVTINHYCFKSGAGSGHEVEPYLHTASMHGGHPLKTWNFHLESMGTPRFFGNVNGHKIRGLN